MFRAYNSRTEKHHDRTQQTSAYELGIQRKDKIMQNLKNRIRIVVHNGCVFFRQARVKKIIGQALQALIAVVIVVLLLKFVWWFGFMLPSERDKYEATKAVKWQQQVQEYENAR